MLLSYIDKGVLEDFVDGLSRAIGLRVAAFDATGERVARPGRDGGPGSDQLTHLPPNLKLELLSGGEPPAGLAFFEHAGRWHVIAPVYLHQNVIGHIAIGEFQDGKGQPGDPPGNVDAQAWREAIAALPPLDRSGEGAAVAAARWCSRMLSAWCRRDESLETAAEEISLLGEIGELLSGERELQAVLDHLVTATARVMRCQYCSLRLYDPKTDTLSIRAVHNLAGIYTRSPTRHRLENPLDAEALEGHLIYIEDARTDPRIQFREASNRIGVVSGLIVGLRYHGEPIGVLRVYTNRKQRFRATQRSLLKAVAAQAAVTIVNAQLFEERLKAAEVERQLAVAAALQDRMIRLPPPQHERLEIAFVFEPSSHVAGDFCDFLPLNDGRLGIVVADVAGKGVAASLLMASVRGALRATAAFTSDLPDLMTRLNRHVCRETTIAEFVTLLMLAIDPQLEHVSYVNAGHEPLLILRDHDIVRTTEGELVVGVDPDVVYEEHSVALRPGDFALMYTDGVIEASNFAGELFGRPRLEEAMLEFGGHNVPQALHNLRWDVRRFVGLAEQSDDLTMVGMRVR